MKILLINRDEDLLDALMRAAALADHEVIKATDPMDAALKVKENIPDIILATMQLADHERSIIAVARQKAATARVIPLITCMVRKNGADRYETVMCVEISKTGEIIDGDTVPWSEAISLIEQINGMRPEKRPEGATEEDIQLYNLINGVYGADGLRPALAFILKFFCSQGPCVYCEAWIPTPMGLALEANYTTKGQDKLIESFADSSRGIVFKPGTGVPGLTFVTKEPIAVRDLSEASPMVVRAARALQAGLSSVVSAPIMRSDDPVAVLVFFMSAHDERFEALLKALTPATCALGPVIGRKIDEEKAREQEKHMDIMTYINVGIFRATHDGIIKEANPAFMSILGVSRNECIDRPIFDFFADRSIQSDLCERLKTKGYVKDQVIEILTRSRKRSLVSLSVFSTKGPDDTDYCNGIIEDITEKKEAEDLASEIQRTEAIGRLSGGIAHEFNNILAAIIGYGNLLLMKNPENRAVTEYTGHILTLSERAAKLTRGMLAFGRKQILILKETDVRGLTSRVAARIKGHAGSRITIKTFVEPIPVLVAVDEAQIMDLFDCLASNSMDAMEKGGTITISSGVVALDDRFLSVHNHGAPGDYALIIFSDTGGGMDEATRKMAFDPFFTTKPVNKGTGLGLSTAYGIIKQHGGFIDLRSAPGKGTAVMLYLPVAGRAKEAAEVRSFTPYSAGSETVLLADDEPDVRITTAAILNEFGYNVLEAKNGKEAIEIFEKNRDRIDIALLDVVMPEICGVTAYYEMAKLSPSVDVIFLSGHPTEMPPEQGPTGEKLHYLPKPFLPGELLSLIRKVIDKQGKTA